MRPTPREINVDEEAHMARLPLCTEECVNTRTWYKRAAGYWRIFGNEFSQDDQETYCRLVGKIGFVPSSHTLSQHPITIGAERDPSWPALILVQLWFKPWAKFKTTKVGRAFTAEFPNADLEYPLPNGDDYPPAPRKTTAARKNILRQWEEIMTLRSQSRMVFSESPRRETPVPLPRNIQYPATAPITVDTPSLSCSASVSRSFSPVGPQRRHHSSPASSVAVILPSPHTKASTDPWSLRSRSEDSSLFVQTPRYVPSPLSRPPITLEDNTAVAPSPVDSDDLPLVRRIHKPQRTMKSSATHQKKLTAQHEEVHDLLTTVTTDPKYCTPQDRRARRSETPSDDDYDFVPNSVEYEVDFNQSPPVSTRTPAFTRGKKRTRIENTTSRDTPRSQHEESMEERLRNLEEGLCKLEDSHAVRKVEFHKQKDELKELKRAIAKLRKAKDSMVVEMKVRARFERRRD